MTLDGTVGGATVLRGCGAFRQGIAEVPFRPVAEPGPHVVTLCLRNWGPVVSRSAGARDYGELRLDGARDPAQ